VTVHVRSGKGGDGGSSFLREKYVDNGGPDGGDGGRGGHIFFVGDHDTDSLVRLYFEPLVVAEEGGSGRKKQMHGKDGADREVKVPCGTSIFDALTGELLADITRHGQMECLARGGKGGLGNIHFKTATHQAPTEHTPGEDSDERDLKLELKTVADVGLLGFPSAGKSSLLASISDAHPKIAAYPFTTLHPIIGTVAYPDYSQIRVADIPGIIKDASEGVGLGLDFLRHVSRSRILLMVIDMAGTDGREPWQDYRTLRAELKAYDAALLDRPTLLVANKMDVPEAKANLAVFRKKVRGRILQISTVDGRGLDTLKTRLWELIRPVAGRREIAEPEAAEAPAVDAPSAPIEPTRVSRILDEAGTEESVEIITADRVRNAGFLVIEPKKKKRR
jgi:GTP-binding protein